MALSRHHLGAALIALGAAAFLFIPNAGQHNICVSDCLFGTKIWSQWGSSAQYIPQVALGEPLIGLAIAGVGIYLIVAK
jgi:hypothetical protein